MRDVSPVVTAAANLLLMKHDDLRQALMHDLAKAKASKSTRNKHHPTKAEKKAAKKARQK